MEHFAHAGGFQLIGEYVDIETGKGCDVLARRPHLAPGPWLRPDSTLSGDLGDADARRGLSRLGNRKRRLIRGALVEAGPQSCEEGMNRMGT